MRPLALLVLVGCGNPISNQQIYEDELFLSALPTTARLAPPSEVRLARVGTSGLLAEAVVQADAMEGLAVVIGAAGEALRSANPDERSDTVRRWEPVSSAVRIDAETTVTFYVRGNVVQPASADLLDWTLELSPDGSAPWTEVATGSHDPVGAGMFTWELAAHAALLGIPEEVPGVLAAEYLDGDEQTPREVHWEDDGLELGGTWHATGENLLIWLGGVVLVAGEEPRPGAAQAFHVDGVGGRGEGTLLAVDGEVPFEVCWDANGNDVWLSEDGTPALGSPSNCPVSFDR